MTDDYRARALDAEARLEAVWEIVRIIDVECPPDDAFRSQWWDAMNAVRTELRAVLSAPSQPEPERCEHGSREALLSEMQRASEEFDKLAPRQRPTITTRNGQ